MTTRRYNTDRNSIRHVIEDVFEGLSRRSIPFGGHIVAGNRAAELEQLEQHQTDSEFSENRYSVLYTRQGRYQHLGCSTQAEAQTVQGMLMTDGDRIPVGIYDSKTDHFEWEMIGAYFHSQDPSEVQQARQDEVLGIARAIRRRDASWDPSYMQQPSFFA